jgi:hypothetical protein
MVRRVAALVLSLFLLTGLAEAGTVAGRVFVDANRNGALDPGEAGAPGVPVSDGLSVVTTAADGGYRLAATAARAIVRVTVPRDRAAPGGFWRAVEGDATADFALVPSPQPDDFLFVQITDTHIGRADVYREFARRIDEFPLPLAFVVHTGDLVGAADTVPLDRAKEQFNRYLDAVSAFDLPVFHVPGNHEHACINHEGSDPAAPLYGKGLYRSLLGPMHYSFDWGPVHFIALDCTRLPYAEALGPEQLEWLAADLSRQPGDKPIVLFCHQALDEIADRVRVADLLADRSVLGAFCGHEHINRSGTLGGFPVSVSGALSGSWWSGPNPDGSPQGFRLVQVKDGHMASAYSDRRGPLSLYVSKPETWEAKQGDVPFEAVVLDLGEPVEVSAEFAGQEQPLAFVSRQELWSTWRGEFDSALAYDGLAELKVTATSGGATGSSATRYLVVNGRPEPYVADAGATFRFAVCNVNAANEVLLNGEPLTTMEPGTPDGTVLSIDVPAERLQRLNRVTFRAVPAGPGNLDDFGVSNVLLEYQGRAIRDIRFTSWRRHSLGDSNPAYPAEKDLYFCLP